MEKVIEKATETETKVENAVTVTKYAREIRVNYRGPKSETFPVREASDVAKFVRKILPDNSREHFVAVYLDGAHQVIGYAVTSSGSANCCLVHPREVFQRAVLLGAVAFVVAHNHPSNRVEPSEEDHRVTRNLKAAGEIMNIKLLDHVVISDTTQHSFSEHGDL